MLALTIVPPKSLSSELKVPLQRNFYTIFIVFLKSTAGMMRNDVYSFFMIHISFPIYRTFYILSCDVISVT